MTHQPQVDEHRETNSIKSKTVQLLSHFPNSHARGASVILAYFSYSTHV